MQALQDFVELGVDFNNAHVQPNGEYHFHGLAPASAYTYAEPLDGNQDIVHAGMDPSLCSAARYPDIELFEMFSTVCWISGRRIPTCCRALVQGLLASALGSKCCFKSLVVASLVQESVQEGTVFCAAEARPIG